VRREWQVLVLLACLTAAAGIAVAGCGSDRSQGPHFPNVTTGVELGSRRGDVTIDVSSTGSGRGWGRMVVTYPNGRRRGSWSGLLMEGVSWSPQLQSLRPGKYKYAVYAVVGPLTNRSLKLLDTSLTRQAVVASGSFVVSRTWP
jgi:hypothetical protein